MKKAKLGDVLSIKHGFAFKSENYVEKSNYALITLANISEANTFQLNREKLTYYGAEFPSAFIMSEGDLIMPLTEQAVGLLGNSALIPNIQGITFVLNQRVGKVIVNEDLADKYYLHYLLSTRLVKEQLEYRASGTSQRNISPDDVYNVEVFIPDIEKQRTIGKLLYSLEKKIELNKAINDNLEKQLRTIYDYWFTQFDFPDENGKPYRSSGGKMVWNDELKREIPEGWSVKKLSEILNVVTGKEDANFSSINGQYKFFTCSNTTLLCDEFAFDGKAVLIAGNGDFNVKHYSGKFNAYQRTYVLIPKEILLRAQVYLVAKQMINNFTKGSNGSIVKFITKRDIENITLLIPHNLQLYKLFNDLLDAIEVNQQEMDQLIKLRDWLLPMLMNGQATVAD